MFSIKSLIRIFAIFVSSVTFELHAAAPLALGDAVPGLHVPAGFTITVYAHDIEGARSMAVGEDGTLYVGTRDEGKVYAVRDLDRNGTGEDVRILAENLELPNGVAILHGDLYIADMTGIRRIPAQRLKSGSPVPPETLFEGFTPQKHHGWKSLKAGPDGKLYVAVGVPCNICQPEGPYEGRLLRIDPHHPVPEILAEGLRNSVGMTFGDGVNDLWLTDNGRDLLGDDVPPDELNHWTGSPVHFGYPSCHGQTIIDPEFGKAGSCAGKTPPAWEFPAHVAALAPMIYRGQQFPARYRNQLFVAQHGSWNRTVPQGYRIVMIPREQNRPVSEQVFIDGWLQSDGSVTGRPVDLLELQDGSVLISDDYADLIYKIRFNAPSSQPQE